VRGRRPFFLRKHGKGFREELTSRSGSGKEKAGKGAVDMEEREKARIAKCIHPDEGLRRVVDNRPFGAAGEEAGWREDQTIAA
jgi:hypothetical protein